MVEEEEMVLNIGAGSCRGKICFCVMMMMMTMMKVTILSLTEFIMTTMIGFVVLISAFDLGTQCCSSWFKYLPYAGKQVRQHCQLET